MAFLAQLFGAVAGATAGYGLGEMMVAGAGGTTFDLRYILAGIGALIGFFIGRVISNRAMRDIDAGGGQDAADG